MPAALMLCTRLPEGVGFEEGAFTVMAQMAAEAGLFTFDDVANAMSDKMVARHPHVFGDLQRSQG